MLNRLFCYLGLCLECVTESDDEGCWGQCAHCGKRHGYTTRAAIRAYIENDPHRMGRK